MKTSRSRPISGYCRCRNITDVVDAQIALFSRNNYLHFTPDPLGDLLFNGIAQTATRSDFASGIQADSSWKVADDHTLRGGVLFQGERASFNTTSSVLPVDAAGSQSAPGPISIGQSGGKTGWLYGIYLQDEWRILPKLTINYGARFDQSRCVHQREPDKPAHQHGLETDAGHHDAYRIRALLRAAAVGSGHADQYCCVPEHDSGARGNAERPGEGHAVKLFRHRHYTKASAGSSGRPRCVFAGGNKRGRRRSVRCAHYPDRVHLCQSENLRWRVNREL